MSGGMLDVKRRQSVWTHGSAWNADDHGSANGGRLAAGLGQAAIEMRSHRINWWGWSSGFAFSILCWLFVIYVTGLV